MNFHGFGSSTYWIFLNWAIVIRINIKTTWMHEQLNVTTTGFNELFRICMCFCVCILWGTDILINEINDCGLIVVYYFIEKLYSTLLRSKSRHFGISIMLFALHFCFHVSYVSGTLRRASNFSHFWRCCSLKGERVTFTNTPVFAAKHNIR